MSVRKCLQGHTIELPCYGIMPNCPDCRDLVEDYAGINGDADIDDEYDEDEKE